MISLKKICCWFTALLIVTSVSAQHKKKISLRDSIDHSFDLSDFIIDANGFILVPIIVSEPALGGFGGGIIPIFLKKRPPYIDSVKGERKVTPVAPDITGGAALYTLNNTWLMAGFRSGTFVKSRIKYIIAGAYGNVNLSFYSTLPQLGEKEFQFNFKLLPVMMQALKRIAVSNWYIGSRYVFLKVDSKYVGDRLFEPSFISPKEYSGLVSQLGVIVELDNRDNVFTPNKGMKVHVDVMRSDNIFGSDFDFTKFNYYMYAYSKLGRKFVLGGRFDGQQVLGDQPFYLTPFIYMRGIPAARYQGEATLLTEVEMRWDFYRRWSLVAFGGTGKAFDQWNQIDEAKWISSFGTGFRYLIARKFQLRMGLDVAKGPDNFAYYIVFGSNWVK